MLDAESGIGPIKSVSHALKDGSSTQMESAKPSLDNARPGITVELVLLASSDITLITEPVFWHLLTDPLISDVESGTGPTKSVYHALKDGPSTQRESASQCQANVRPGTTVELVLPASSDITLATEPVFWHLLLDLVT